MTQKPQETTQKDNLKIPQGQQKNIYKKEYPFFKLFLAICVWGILSSQVYFFFKIKSLEHIQDALSTDIFVISTKIKQNNDSIKGELNAELANFQSKIAESKESNKPDSKQIIDIVQNFLKTQSIDAGFSLDNKKGDTQQSQSIKTTPPAFLCVLFLKQFVEMGKPFDEALKLLKKTLDAEKIPYHEFDKIFDLLNNHSKTGVITIPILQKIMPQPEDTKAQFLPMSLSWFKDFIHISKSNQNEGMLFDKITNLLRQNNLKEALSLLRHEKEGNPEEALRWNDWVEKATLYQSCIDGVDQLIIYILNSYL